MKDDLTVGELYTILLEPRPSSKLKRNEEGLFKLIPELKKCKGFNQYSPWHKSDVYNHILDVVDFSPRDLTVSLAALFHDIGKTDTLVIDEKGHGHYPNHWIKSKEIFKKFAYENKLNTKLTYDVASLIYYHDLRITNDNMLYDLRNKLGLELTLKLYELKYADIFASNTEFYYELDNLDVQVKKLKKKK